METVIILFIFVLGIPIFLYVKLISKLLKKNKQFKDNYFNDFFKENEFILNRECSINNTAKIMIDTIHKKFAICGNIGIECFNFDDLIDFEIIENGSSVIQGKVGATLVGGFLLGSVGALAGSSSAKKVSNISDNLTLKVYLNNNEINVISEIINGYSIAKNSYEYQQLSKRVDEIVGMLKYIKAQSLNNTYTFKEEKKIEEYEDYSVPKKVIEETPKDIENENNSNSLEQLEKLAELKAKGIITEEEFDENKKKILGRL